MVYPTSAQWTKWNIESERHRFFYLRWRELFDMSTFDTWQVRSSNIRSMLDELEESARVLAVTKSHHPNIQALLSEMEVVATHDRVIRDHLPAIRTHIAQLRKLYENEIDLHMLAMLLGIELKNVGFPLTNYGGHPATSRMHQSRVS